MTTADPAPKSYAVEAEKSRRGRRAPPAIDDNLLEDESRYEIVDGRVHHVASARPPHAIRHTEVAFVLRANTAPGYVSALDMMARVAEDSEIAPDASIFPDGVDERTGGRRLEELVVEVTGQQSFPLITQKAQKFAERGVRRVLCVRIKRGEVLEWDHVAKAWKPLPRDGSIVDACLVRPVAVRALLDAATANEEAARGLLASGTPVLGEALAEARHAGHVAGHLAGHVDALRTVLAARGLTPTDAQHAEIAACRDAATLTRWLARAATVAEVEALFAD